MVSLALPEKQYQNVFVNSFRDYETQIYINKEINYKIFWNDYLPNIKEFKEHPDLISNLLLTQQLTIISGSYQPLMEELKIKRKLLLVTDLLEYKNRDWQEIILKTGVPQYIKGENEEEKNSKYKYQIQTFLNAAYPTQKIVTMLKNMELPIKNDKVRDGIIIFLTHNKLFDINSSNIDEFEKGIKYATPEDFENVKAELKRIQRVYEVSPTPKVMKELMKNDLNSAQSISGYSKKNFVKMFRSVLGGDEMAKAVYERSTNTIKLLNENSTNKQFKTLHSFVPSFYYGDLAFGNVVSILSNNISNYFQLFGCQEICKCGLSLSVCSPVVYIIELLRFFRKCNNKLNLMSR